MTTQDTPVPTPPGDLEQALECPPTDTVLAAWLAEVSQHLLPDGNGGLTTELVVQRALDVVPKADGCGLTLRGRRGVLGTAASTSKQVSQADQAQYDLDEGPCLESAEGAGSFRSHDLAADTRWSLWSPRAVEIGFRSVLSIRLSTDREEIGAINLYAEDPHAFGDDAVNVAEVYASLAASALSQAKLVEGLRTAVDSRHQIGVAQGILMARYELSTGQAFEVLRRLSNDHNLPLRQVATRIVEVVGIPEELGR